MLHEQGIVHGDLKPENVIMCLHGEKKLVPKWADFGFAIIEAAEVSDVVIGGTRTWAAPEAFRSLNISHLKLTDIYSLGLVAWSIAIDGKDPFSLILPTNLQIRERLAEIQRLKDADAVLTLSNFDNWAIRWSLSSRLDELLPQLGSAHLQASKGSQDTATALSNPDTVKSMIYRLLNGPQQQQQVRNTALNILDAFRKRGYYQDLEEAFSYTLSKSPSNRNLSKFIRLLEKKEPVSDLRYGKDLLRIIRLTIQ